MDDRLDVPLEDAELLAEVELTTNLIIAASEADADLTREQIDQLLGISCDAVCPTPVSSQNAGPSGSVA